MNVGDFADQDYENAVDTNRRRQVFPRRPKQAGDLVSAIIARHGIAAKKSNNQLARAWEEAAGTEIANSSRVASIRGGVLEVIVENSALMQMITFEQEKLLNTINSSVKKPFRKMRFRIGRIN